MWGRPQKLSANENLGPSRDDIEALFRDIRARSVALVAPLTAEDQCIQSMADVSPTKWHLAHTSWFFETFILKPFGGGYGEFHPDYDYLFNSITKPSGPGTKGRSGGCCRGHRWKTSTPTVATSRRPWNG